MDGWADKLTGVQQPEGDRRRVCGLDPPRHPSAAVLAASELQQLMRALSNGKSVVYYRQGDGALHTLTLEAGSEVMIGRRPDAEIRLGWDRSVSRLHAILRGLGAAWLIEDNGFSRNGTFVNGSRVTAPRRLEDGDAILIGATLLTFRASEATFDERTEVADQRIRLTVAQQRVLVALCRPVAALSGQVGPATNRQIADELVLSVETVKSHMRALAGLFSVTHLPQNQRRYAIARRALELGLVSERAVE